MVVYGKGQFVRYRSAIVLARFLGGRSVHAVWVQFEEDPDTPRQTRLLISTDLSLTAQQIIEAYALRWTIEPMFNSLKNAIGMKEVWQQRRQTLHRWVHILSAAFALTQMMAVHDPAIALQVAVIAPWRKETHLTAGMVRRGLANIFRNVSISAIWDRKCGKFITAADGQEDRDPGEIAGAA